MVYSSAIGRLGGFISALEQRGSSYVGQPEVFLQATGENGFAPTAVAVHPVTGDLYVSIGGRGTRGAVYRIRYVKGEVEKPAGASERLTQPATLEEWISKATGSDLLAPLCSGMDWASSRALHDCPKEASDLRQQRPRGSDSASGYCGAAGFAGR